MEPRTRICLSNPPEGFDHLKNETGVILRLLPQARNPLIYCAHVNSVDLNVSPQNVQLLDIVADDGEGDMAIINNLCYCQEHRLEVCGTCGFNFRVQNIMRELGNNSDDDVLIAGEIDDALDAMNFPPRKAPGTKSFNAVVADALNTIIPDNLNPTALTEWPRDQDMYKCADKTWGDDEYKVPDSQKLPLRRVRESLLIIGLRLSEFQKNQANSPALRIFLQDKAQ